MNRKTVMIIVGLFGLLAFGIACAGDQAATEPQDGGADSSADLLSATLETVDGDQVNGEFVGQKDIDVDDVDKMIASLALAQDGLDGGGIWVVGEASVSVEPDIAHFQVGVSATAESVAAARSDAAGAMEAVVAALKAQGLSDRDIQTSAFSISPRYDWVEEIVDGRRTDKRVLTGYEVNNTVAVTVRSLDTVGDLIDASAEAGGDSTRIHGISFSVEDTSQHMPGLREGAVVDALAEANHLAGLAGVSVGRLLYIGQVTAGAPVGPYNARAYESLAMDQAATATVVSGGETQLTMKVQAVFAIE